MSHQFSDGLACWIYLASRSLGWRPSEFWRATPAELISSLQDPDHTQSAAPPSRDTISKMMERDSNERQF